jgi:hypothetical protein
MTSRGVRRRPLRIGSRLFAAAALGASLLVGVSAGPAAAHMPIGACAYEHQTQYQIAGDGTEDYAVWECTKTKVAPYYLYWKLSSISNFKEQREAFKSGIGRFVRDEIWSGIVQGGFGIFYEGPYDRAHIRYEGSFDLRNWQGGRINRNMGVHMVLKHSVSGGPYTACADTGWKDASSPTSGVSYTSWKLRTSCTGSVVLYTRAHFFQLSTSTWWTSSWIKAGPYIPGV